MIKFIVLAIVGLLVCTVLLVNSFDEEKGFKKRKIQGKNLLKENVIRNKLDEFTKEKVKISKRLKIEKLCIQAGYDIIYSDYLMICIITSVLLFIFFTFVLNNKYLGILLLIIGLFLPNQYFTVKANSRTEKMNKQVGPFLKMLIERYKLTKDIKKSIITTAEEFKGEYPISNELDRLIIRINLGNTIEDSLEKFAIRVDNKFLIRFVDYYKIYSDIGTSNAMALLDEALKQYNEDRKNKLLLKKEISSIKSESYIVLFSIPLVALYQIISNKDYVPFMTQTVVGQIGTAVIVIVTLASFWFINKKIGAPIK